ncbi:hypothetical protein pf16_144 [Pseudomonas phage pf16]|uniref:Uncharacterized protein n=1 Tax=Pseudomonas phage pf16 TaxID=1815630 RepID=A0A1S5R3T3_9CAUD|nr:hypothetical protein FDG98_gp154 [Pseudomonas phage pf16]AND75067.1 hypothetical protein pf16_144 [Pseudomonas phage pf16]
MYKDANEFSLYIEKLKVEREFDTYMETIMYFYENETDHEMADIAKMLNRKIIGELQLEGEASGLLKGAAGVVLF